MISIVIPVLDEAESLEQLHGELDAVAREHDYKLDIIFVDDGSTDKSWSLIQSLAKRDSRVHGIRFRRNFGKAAALSAGFDAAQGDLVMTLDSDLQDDPKEIPRFIEKLSEGSDVVSGWKQVRYDPWHKVWPSRVFNWLVRRMTGVQLHDINCGMKCYRREVLHEVRLYGEMHRFVPALAAARGFRICEISIDHRPRQHGNSKYGFQRFYKGFLDLLTVVFLTGFGQRPQHLLGGFGLAAFLLGALGMTYLAVMWCVTRSLSGMEPLHVSSTAMLYYSLGGVLLGGQLISMGFLAELITAYTGRDADAYSIVEQTRDATDDRAYHEDFEASSNAQPQDQSLSGDA
ncbi:MAG: glycosyltransferase family 2 protein [Pirellulales bacterium]